VYVANIQMTTLLRAPTIDFQTSTDIRHLDSTRHCCAAEATYQ